MRKRSPQDENGLGFQTELADTHTFLFVRRLSGWVCLGQFVDLSADEIALARNATMRKFQHLRPRAEVRVVTIKEDNEELARSQIG